jgi:outer membrane protein
MILKKITSICCLALLTSSAYAKDISEYLADAYSNSDTLKQSQMKFKTEVEDYPAALTGFLPGASYNINKFAGANGKIPNENFMDSTSNPSGINVNMNLFNGGGSMAVLRMAQTKYYTARLAFYDSEQKFLAESIKTYLDYYEAIQICKISDMTVEHSRKNLDSVEARLKLGEATKTDLAFAQSSYSASLSQKSDSMSKLIQAKTNFITSFGSDDENIALPEIPDLRVVDKNDLQEKMLTSNLDLNHAKYAINTSKLQILASASRLAPSVSANLNVSSDSNYISSIGIQVPIFNNATNSYSETRKARYALRSATYNLNNITNKIRDLANVAWSQFESSKLQVQYLLEASDAGKLAYEGTVKEEEVGNKSILDVLEAQSKWNNTQIKYIEAQKNMLMAAYIIRQLSGQLTAKSLRLDTNLFEPEKEFKKIKFKLIGF